MLRFDAVGSRGRVSRLTQYTSLFRTCLRPRTLSVIRILAHRRVRTCLGLPGCDEACRKAWDVVGLQR